MGEKQEIDAATEAILKGLKFKDDDQPPPASEDAFGAFEGFLKENENFSKDFAKQKEEAKNKAEALLKAFMELKDKKERDGQGNDEGGDKGDTRKTKPSRGKDSKDSKENKGQGKKEDPCAARLLAKDEEIAELKRQLEIRTDQLRAKNEEVVEQAHRLIYQDRELQAAKDYEAITCPEGMNWETYLDSLEQKIAAFRKFIQGNLEAVFAKPEEGSRFPETYKCRECGRGFNLYNTPESRLKTEYHYENCSLKKALS